MRKGSSGWCIDEIGVRSTSFSFICETRPTINGPIASTLITVLHHGQELIKVWKWIPHIGLIPKVVFRHAAQFFYITRAIRGQPKRLSRNYPRRMAGMSSYMFWFRVKAEMFSALSALLLFTRFWLVLRSCGRYLDAYSVSGSQLSKL